MECPSDLIFRKYNMRKTIGLDACPEPRSPAGYLLDEMRKTVTMMRFGARFLALGCRLSKDRIPQCDPEVTSRDLMSCNKICRRQEHAGDVCFRSGPTF